VKGLQQPRKTEEGKKTFQQGKEGTYTIAAAEAASNGES